MTLLLWVFILLVTPAQVPVASATLSGIVVTSDVVPQPVRRAAVSVIGGPRAATYQAVTDDDGRYTLAGLLPGTYRLTASRPAFVTLINPPVVLEPGQQATDVRLLVARGAVITGTVRHTDGAPVPNLEMRVEGQDSIRATRTVHTDDRGVYRFYGLPAGTYLVSARPRAVEGGPSQIPTDAEVDAALAALQAGRAGRTPPAPPRTGKFATMYYPQGFVPEHGTLLSVGTGGELAAIDITLVMTRSRLP
jgi:hypothetical protein